MGDSYCPNDFSKTASPPPLSESGARWGRYEVKRQTNPANAPYDPHAVHDITSQRLYAGEQNGEGLVWYIESKGYVYKRQEERIKDELDRPEAFIAVTKAVIYNPDGTILLETEFVAINRSHIIWVTPDNDIHPMQK